VALTTLVQAFLKTCRSFSQRADVSRLMVGAGWLLGSNIFVSGLSAIKGLLLARILGVEQYGIVGLTIAYVTVFSQIFDARSTDAVIRFGTEFRETGRPDKIRQIITVCLTAETLMRGIGLICICLTASWASIWLTKTPNNAGLMCCYSLTLIAAIPYGCCSGLVRLYDRFALHGRADAFAAIVELIGILLLWAHGASILSMFMVLIAAAWLKTIAMIIAAFRASGTLLHSGWQLTSWNKLYRSEKSLFNFLFFSNVMGVIKGAQATGDTLVVGWFLSPLYVGYYRLAKQIAHIFIMPAGTLYLVAFPELAKVWQKGGPDKLRRWVRGLSFASVALMLVILVPILVWGAWSIEVIAGKEFAGAWPTAKVMLLGTIILIAALFPQAGLVAAGFIRGVSNAFFLSTLVYLILLLTITPTFGIVGAAWAYVFFAITRLILLSHQLDSTTAQSSSSQTDKTAARVVPEM
jgi:O-antigen/teichoic acid export membrane protein